MRGGTNTQCARTQYTATHTLHRTQHNTAYTHSLTHTHHTRTHARAQVSAASLQQALVLLQRTLPVGCSEDQSGAESKSDADGQSDARSHIDEDMRSDEDADGLTLTRNPNPITRTVTLTP